MIAFCTRCGGAIVRGDDDFVRDMARRGFAHRDCRKHPRPKSAKEFVEEVLQAVRERQSKSLSELATPSSKGREA
jgi:hypothetical protein